MTKAEAIEILDRFKNWNHGQKSTGHAFGGPREFLDEVYDERRRLILKATRALDPD